MDYLVLMWILLVSSGPIYFIYSLLQAWPLKSSWRTFVVLVVLFYGSHPIVVITWGITLLLFLVKNFRYINVLLQAFFLTAYVVLFSSLKGLSRTIFGSVYPAKVCKCQFLGVICMWSSPPWCWWYCNSMHRGVCLSPNLVTCVFTFGIFLKKR